MEQIAFPNQCQNQIECYRSTLALYKRVESSLPDKIIFDCGNVGFFRPMGLNLLACFISEILSKKDHPAIYFTPPKNHSVFEYIKTQGFFDCFQFESEKLLERIESRIQHETFHSTESF